MTGILRAWRRKSLLRRNPVPDRLWRACVGTLPLLHRLTPEELARLREQVALFIAEKSFSAGNDFVIDDALILSIAAQACLPILNLDFSLYDGWQTVIVYPAEFVVNHEYTDDFGIVHVTRDILAGEAWLRGPLIVSAEDVKHSGSIDGVNVVIHECAHKLDMLDGDANGYPPLHRDMSAARWSEVFQSTYDDFSARIEHDEHTDIDPYAAENPAEFFAVLSEAFFTTPSLLKQGYGQVYSQLKDYYRQDPAGAT